MYVLLIVVTCMIGPIWAQSVTPVTEPSATPILSTIPCINALGLRYRSFGNTGADEVYMGVGDLGVGANRVAQGKVWASPGTYRFNWTYDVNSDSMTSRVSGSPDLIYSNVATNLQQRSSCNASDIVAAVFFIVNRDLGTTVNLNSLFLTVGNGTLQNLSSSAYIGLTGFNEFPVLPVPQAYFEGFTFSGEFFINGTFGTAQERSRLDFMTCCNIIVTPTGILSLHLSSLCAPKLDRSR